MPEEKSTDNQIAANHLYHGRNYTLRELAHSNFIERRLAPDNYAPYLNYRIDAIDAAVMDIPAPYSGTVEYYLIIGWESGAPGGPFALSSFGGEAQYQSLGLDGFALHINACRIANSIAIIVGDSEAILKLNSPLDFDFEIKNPPVPGKSLYCVEFANGVWLAAGEDGRILKSTNNGNDWADKSIPSLSDNVLSLAYGNGRWIALCEENKYYYSVNNGETWTYGGEFPLNPGGVSLDDMRDIIFDGEQFVVIGEETAAFTRGYVATSPNGSVWTPGLVEENSGSPLPVGANLHSIVYEGGVYYILGASGMCFYSLDGAKTWYWRSCPIWEANDFRFYAKKATFFKRCVWIAGMPYTAVPSDPRVFRTQRLY